MGGTAVDFLLVHLKQMIISKEIDNQFPEVEKLQILYGYEDLCSLRTFLIDSDKMKMKMSYHNKHDEEYLKDLVTRITYMANKAEENFIIFVDFLQAYKSGMLVDVLKEIESLNKVVSKIYENKLYGIGDPRSGSSSSSSSNSTPAEDETVVGFDHELKKYTPKFPVREREIAGTGTGTFTVTVTGAVTGTAVDFLLENLKQVIMNCKKMDNRFSKVEMFEIQSVYEVLCSLRDDLFPSDRRWGADAGASDAIYFLLENLKQVIMNCKKMDNQFSMVEKLQIQSVYEVLCSLRNFLIDSDMRWHKHEELKDVVFRITDMANQAEDIIDDSLVNDKNIIENNYPSSYNIKLRNEGLSSRQIQPVLESLKRLMNNKDMYNQFSGVKKLQIESLLKQVSRLRSLRDDELLELVIPIRKVAGESKYIFDKRNLVANTFSHVYQSGKLINVLKEIKSLNKVVSNIFKNKLYGIGDPPVGMYSRESSSSSSGSSSSSSSRAGLPIVEGETVVGFDNDVDTIRERLAGVSKQLDVISIVGMAGLGKTTLAKKLYNDAFVAQYFYVRGWTYVSQVYAKRDLLLSILSSVVEQRDVLHTMTDDKLGEELYKGLKLKRYLIVMDDMWNIGAWNDMKRFFPNDNNGSRIIITSRLAEVTLLAKPDSPPHLLQFLPKDESWNLLKHKAFGKESCPPDLVEIGEQIAQKCQGLPLAIVVVAGLLARTGTKKMEWERVSGSLSSHIAVDLEQCMNNTLELSYYHLPRHLRLCFLYFGAFPEDYEICARKLIWLWIAEGFIHQIGQKTLEDVAKDYLTDLIERSLVLVSSTKLSGGIRACHVHDLLRDLCVRKGKEENFMQQIYRHETLSSNDSFPIGEKQRRLCIFSHYFDCISSKTCAPRVRSLLCFEPTWGKRSQHISWICQAFKLLRVLDLSAIFFLSFPSEILQLVLLRYLELRGRGLTLPESISELLNLETLDVSNIMGVVPPYIWKMVNLRHLRIDGDDYASPPNYNYPSILHNLQTISQLCPTSCQVILARTPNLRKLGFYGHFKSKEGNFWFPDLHFLNHLEKLKLCKVTNCGTPLFGRRWSLQGVNFPPNLRRLTLSRTELYWEEMSTLGMLCNLEVLKLEYSAFVGPRWETTGGGFQRLKFLRLIEIHIEQWEASNTDFPSLQQLVLRRCRIHEGIPFEFGDIPTLQRIEVDWCSQSTENSAKNIQKEQQNQGNYLLKLHIKS